MNANPPTINTSIPTDSPHSLGNQTDPSPSSSCTSSGVSVFDSPSFASLSVRTCTGPTDEGPRRASAGSMTSWGSVDDVDYKSQEMRLHSPSTSQACSAVVAPPQHSPHEITTPECDGDDHFADYFIQRSGSVSPSSSTPTSDFGEITPRAELPAPAWPRNLASPTKDCDDLTIGEEGLVKKSGSIRRKHSSPHSLHTSPMRPHSAYFARAGYTSHTEAAAGDGNQSHDPPRRLSESASAQRVVAQSSATGCRISAPMSPPAHYPGSAGQRSRRSSSSRNSTDTCESNNLSLSSDARSCSASGKSRSTPPAPRWAHPPRQTNKITGRAWSFSQGQERPELDFDPELFDQAEPDAVQEILKGMEGRIAVKTTPLEYNIMAWLPGFSIDDITISMKGDRTVQIVADLWDEGDHAQWNVLLGEDVNKSAISAKLEGSELRVTVKRRQFPAARSLHTTFSSWSGPVTAIAAPQIAGGLTSASTRPGLAIYPRPPQVSH